MPFLVGLDDFVEHGDFDLFELFAEVVMNNFVKFSKRLPEFGIEVVFNAVVSPRLK